MSSNAGNWSSLWITCIIENNDDIRIIGIVLKKITKVSAMHYWRELKQAYQD